MTEQVRYSPFVERSFHWLKGALNEG